MNSDSIHFALAEFLYSDTAKANGIDNTPTWQNVENLTRVANVMERVRQILGSHSVTITSGYRCAALNAAVGGVADSAHLSGLACDFVVPAYGAPAAICKVLEPHLVALDIDQLIMEGTWIHLGLADGAARHECFSIV